MTITKIENTNNGNTDKTKQRKREYFQDIINHNQGNMTYQMVFSVFLPCKVAINDRNMQYQCLHSVTEDKSFCNMNFENKQDDIYIFKIRVLQKKISCLCYIKNMLFFMLYDIMAASSFCDAQKGT